MAANILAPADSKNSFELTPDLRRLLTSEPTPVLLVADGRVVFVNLAAARLFKRSLIAENLLQLSDPNARQQLERFFHRSAASTTAVPGMLKFVPDVLGVETDTVRCTGAVLRPATPLAPAIIIVRLKNPKSDINQFALLGKKIADHEQEIRRRRTAESELRNTLALFMGVFENAAVGMVIVDLDGRFNKVNDHFCNIVGFGRDELTKMTFVDLTHPDDIESDLESVNKLERGAIGSYQMVKRYIRKDETVIWVRITVALARHAESGRNFFVAIVEDYEDRKAAEETRDLLVGELNHRVKNTLAMVQGIVQQTLRSTPEPKAFAAVLQPRLTSLSKAHNLLSQRDWASLMLGQLLQATLDGAFGPYASRISRHGDDVKLSSQETVLVTLILHELLTNAIKHGSLSVEQGTVKIDARFNPTGGDKAFTLEWIEQGGPAAVSDGKRGFGMFVLEDGASHSLGGVAETEFTPDGLKYTLTCPLRFSEQ